MYNTCTSVPQNHKHYGSRTLGGVPDKSCIFSADEMRANKLKTVLSRDCWLVWSHLTLFMYMYVHHVHVHVVLFMPWLMYILYILVCLKPICGTCKCTLYIHCSSSWRHTVCVWMLPCSCLLQFMQPTRSRPQRGQRVQYHLISDDSDDSDFMV